jgi:hypothetical protein
MAARDPCGIPEQIPDPAERERSIADIDDMIRLLGTPSFNPVRITLGEWIAMLHDAWTAQGATARLRALFGPPGA